jgi:hypothetical protein
MQKESLYARETRKTGVQPGSGKGYEVNVLDDEQPAIHIGLEQPHRSTRNARGTTNAALSQGVIGSHVN